MPIATRMQVRGRRSWCRRVLGSMYPAVMLLLAHRLSGERLDTVQQIGISAVLGGSLLLSA